MIFNKNKTTYFEWTPKLSCLTPSEAPIVTYTAQKGYGCKIKISDTLSLVFVSCYIGGNITAVSSGNNYATIEGLPYSQSLSYCVPSFNFHDFYQAVADGHPIPTGFVNNKTIRVQNGTRGSSVDKWVVCNNFEIRGSGFYFTNQ